MAKQTYLINKAAVVKQVHFILATVYSCILHMPRSYDAQEDEPVAVDYDISVNNNWQ